MIIIDPFVFSVELHDSTETSPESSGHGGHLCKPGGELFILSCVLIRAFLLFYYLFKFIIFN